MHPSPASPSSSRSPETLLGTVESILADVGALLLKADAPALERSAPLLQQAALELSRCLENRPASAPPLPADWARRVQAVRSQLSLQREQLARLAALTNRQVATFLPPDQNGATYGSRGPAGSGMRGSAARIYRSQS
ncbi:hypothetical protein QRO11_02120 [Paracidovorax citrulli]|uniref:Flagellar protein FlgN n=2 Tax=Paracidovorax citrulli TaxID=80869 RepID=A1TVG9_PARC0|nr:hypothetical protein [Paracidovorax citrulli]ABM34957.1 hypothetical protein Aave_4417 [Paracidovorax citrulli AAC00-1]ATG96497.1 hypothetical protein CQB05_22820 [Paracidovorax citrulli]MVT30018.1 hypothetical protein [Paracidovorax citrulli]PVY64405.1 hypothetical protein C8E08_1725 [Paracidovorax citrulli]QCX10314.1 hypothetical protein APS58_1423 [Paracidovorax citrulli]